MAEMLTLAAFADDPDRFHLIDVGDVDDNAAAHVAGAVHVPLAELAKHARKIQPRGRPGPSAAKTAVASQRARMHDDPRLPHWGPVGAGRLRAARGAVERRRHADRLTGWKQDAADKP